MLLAASWMSVAALAAGGGASSRVGFVDMARIDREAPQIDTVRGELQKEFSERERQLLEQQMVLRTLEERLAREGPDMESKQRRQLERELQSGQREWKRKQDEFREDYIIRKNEEMEDLTKTITDTIRDFARAENFDVILVSGVVYASDASDVTSRILDWLTKQQQQRNENDDKRQQP
jgi:outer membrane protein